MTERKFRCVHCGQIMIIESADGRRPSNAGCNDSYGVHNWVFQP
jgi:predicted RNA-binding Zn-ribbon protein involved in translation (DUF1610 family)